MDRLIVKSGREKSLKRRHPWVFSGAVERMQGRPAAGDTVEIRSAGGELLALAAYSPHSQIRARVWSWNTVEIDASFIRERVERSAALRATAAADDRDALRLVHGEADGLPGIIADRYGETVVMQLLSAGAERWRDALADAFVRLPGVARVWERSDADVRQLEGLEERVGLVRGEAPPAEVLIREHGLCYGVEIAHGHKTGFYLDQRENRQLLRRGLDGASVLNCFAYTGGFGLAALDGGAAHVLSIEASGSALELASRNVELNGYSMDRCAWLEGDVFVELRRLRDRGMQFDVVVLDPPRFAATVAQSDRAARGYKDINLLAFKLLRPGGRLYTFSCSGGVSPDLFQKIVAGAALDAGVDATVIGWLGQPEDHPVSLAFPEGRYLKGLICRVAA